MAAFNFPNSPSTNDIHNENGVSFKWNGTVWKKIGTVANQLTQLGVTGVSTFTGNVTTNGNITVGGAIYLPQEIAHYGDTDTNITFPSADTIAFDTGGSERIRIDSNGRVMVGQTRAYDANDRDINFKTGKTFSIEVSGFKETPAFLLKDLIFFIVLTKSLVASGCTVIMSAPASAKFLIKLLTGEIIR